MLKWTKPYPAPSFFPPDSMENIRHAVPDGYTIVVRDDNGVPICGRVIEGAKGKAVLYATGYVWKPK